MYRFEGEVTKVDKVYKRCVFSEKRGFEGVVLEIVIF